LAIKNMTVHELAKKILNEERLFILDVRNPDDFDDWKIEGRHVEIVNAPYLELLDGIDGLFEKLPKEEPILVVCARGRSSLVIAEQLAEAGFADVYSLEGGMTAWSECLEPVKIGDLQGGGAIYQFVRLGKGCLSYLIASGGEAAVVDAARMIDVYRRFADGHGLVIKYALDTHLHADHISGGKALAEAVNGMYYLPPKDGEQVGFAYQPLVEGGDISVGQTKIVIRPVYSPGHTIGSTSLIVDGKYLLTGDTLFVDSIGRPDLAGKAREWVGDLRNTLHKKYKGLPQDLIVLPAHFARINEMENGRIQATLATLFEKNVGLRVQDEEAFRRMVTGNLPPQPNAYQEIRQVNMGKLTPEENEQRMMEIGPNRCAVH